MFSSEGIGNRMEVVVVPSLGGQPAAIFGSTVYVADTGSTETNMEWALAAVREDDPCTNVSLFFSLQSR